MLLDLRYLWDTGPSIGFSVVLVENASVVVLQGATPAVAADALAVAIDDQAGVIVALLAPSDAFAVALVDVASLVLALASSTDALPVSLDDLVSSLVASLAAADALAATLDDRAAVAAMAFGADSVAVAVDDAVAAILALLAASDAQAVALAESGALVAAFLVGETVVVALVAAAALLEVLEPATPVVASDAVALALDEFGAAAITTPSDPGPAAIPSYSAGWRAPSIMPQYPARLVVPISAREVVASGLVEADEPVIVAPDGASIDSRYWRDAIEVDDEEVLLLI